MNGGETKRINFVSYILYFLYEQRGVDDYFATKDELIDTFMVFRLCAVKDACGLEYDENNSELYVKQIENYYKYVMYPHHDRENINAKTLDYSSKLLDKINSILKIYKKYEVNEYMKKLKEYLDECITKNNDLCDAMYDTISELDMGASVDEACRVKSYNDFVVKWSGEMRRIK